MSLKISTRQNNVDGTTTPSTSNFFDNLLNSVGPNGVKTDVSITLAPSNFIYMGIAVFISVGLILLVNKLLTDLFKKA